MPDRPLVNFRNFNFFLLFSSLISNLISTSHNHPFRIRCRQEELMRKPVLALTALILSIVTIASATSQPATCPQDGETASFTGNKKVDTDHPFDHSKDMCEYSHQHLVQDASGTHTQTHTFWQN